MNDELRKLLCMYVDNNKFADYDFIMQVFNIFVKRYGNSGVKEVVIIDEEQRGISDFENSIIGINLDYIKNDLMGCNWYTDIKSNLYFVNIYVILILKHEFNHFRQIRKYKSVLNSNNFLDKLFVNSFIMTCFSSMELINIYNDTEYNNDVEMEKLYDEYHDCFAVERLAQIDAYRNIVEIISPIQEELGEVYYYYLYEYYFYKIKDYNLIDGVILSPIDKILIQMECFFQYQDNTMLLDDGEEDIDEFYDDIINEYSIHDRFRYGLPITVSEYENTMDFVNVMYMLSGNDNYVKKRKRYYGKKKK